MEELSIFVKALTIFVLALFVGFEVIRKVPPLLHTPLMSGANAISGITLVGTPGDRRPAAYALHHHSGSSRRRDGDRQRGGRLPRDPPHVGHVPRTEDVACHRHS